MSEMERQLRQYEVDVRTVVEQSSPYRNCRYANAFRAPCPEVNALVPDTWCSFCQSHTRLRAALAALP